MPPDSYGFRTQERRVATPGNWLLRLLNRRHNYYINNGDQIATSNGLRFSINRSTTGGDGTSNSKAQIAFSDPMTFGDRYIFNFDLFIPADWIDSTEDEGCALWSIYNTPNPGENWLSGPVTLYIMDGKLIWHVRGSADPAPRPNQRPHAQHSSAITKGEWTSVRVEYVPDCEEGLVRIYYGGNLAFEHRGCTAYNDQRGPTFKFGLYHWKWATGVNYRRVHYRNIRVNHIGGD